MITINTELKEFLKSVDEPNVGGLAGMPQVNWQVVEVPISTTVCPSWANLIQGDKAVVLYIQDKTGYLLVREDIRLKLKTDYGWESRAKLVWTDGSRIFRGQRPFAYANVIREWLPVIGVGKQDCKMSPESIETQIMHSPSE